MAVMKRRPNGSFVVTVHYDRHRVRRHGRDELALWAWAYRFEAAKGIRDRTERETTLAQLCEALPSPPIGRPKIGASS